MLDLHLDQFADPGPCHCQRPYDVVPSKVILFPQIPLEVFVILVADRVVQERGFRDLDHLDFQVGTLDEIQILVDAPDAQVHGLGLVVFDEIGPVLQQRLLADGLESVEEIPDRIRMRRSYSPRNSLSRARSRRKSYSSADI